MSGNILEGEDQLKTKKYFAILLILILVICGQGNLAAAEEKPNEEQDKVEIIEQRDADKKYYALPEGTLCCLQPTGPFY